MLAGKEHGHLTRASHDAETTRAKQFVLANLVVLADRPLDLAIGDALGRQAILVDVKGCGCHDFTPR